MVMPVGDNSSSHWFLQTTVLCSREWMQLSCNLSSCLLFLLEKEKTQHCYYLICLVVFFSGLFRRAGRGFRSRSFQIQTINQITMLQPLEASNARVRNFNSSRLQTTKTPGRVSDRGSSCSKGIPYRIRHGLVPGRKIV